MLYWGWNTLRALLAFIRGAVATWVAQTPRVLAHILSSGVHQELQCPHTWAMVCLLSWDCWDLLSYLKLTSYVLGACQQSLWRVLTRGHASGHTFYACSSWYNSAVNVGHTLFVALANTYGVTGSSLWLQDNSQSSGQAQTAEMPGSHWGTPGIWTLTICLQDRCSMLLYISELWAF